MQAARYYKAGKLEIETVPIPEPEAGEVLVKIAFAGICGSDLHEYRQGPLTCTSHPHPLTGNSPPVTLSHEFSGVIAKCGEGVDTKKLAVGTRVCIEPVFSCLKCEHCLGGTPQLCDKNGLFGYNRDGGMAEFAVITEANCHVVPDNVSLEAAAVVEPLSCAWHAVALTNFKAGDTALVLGCGPIGALVTRTLRAMGASWIGVSDLSEARRSCAVASGADAVYNPAVDDVVKETIAATKGGCQYAFDCAGVQRTLETSIFACRPSATIMMVAVWEGIAQLNLNYLLHKEKILRSTLCFTGEDIRAVLKALGSGSIKVDDLVTAKILLKDVVKNGLEPLQNDPQQVKILVDLEASLAANKAS